MYDATVQNHWKLIKKHPELQGGLYSSAIAAGEKLASRWSKFGFYWSFAVWIPALAIPAPVNIVFAVIDGLVAVYIGLITTQQSAYNPQNIGACAGGGSHTFQLPPGANESFFEAAARLNATKTDAFQMCKSFVLEWQYGIAITSIYSTITVLNVILSLYACMLYRRSARQQNKPLWKLLLHTTASIPKVILITLLALFYAIPMMLFRLLPISIKARIRFARRWGVKASLAVEEKGEMQMKAFKRKAGGSPNQKMYADRGDGKPASLADFLGVYDMLIMVVQNLHYVDITNLSLVSRSVREAVLPADAYTQRMMHFKMYTCSPRNKRQCWSCMTQICNRCRTVRSIKQTTPLFHLDSCRPHCTPCYYNIVHNTIPASTLSARNARPMDPRSCHCAPPTSHPNIFQRYFNTTQYYTSRQTTLPQIRRSICKTCAALNDDDLLAKREGRSRMELKVGRGTQKCKVCEKVLGGGPRWWVCRLCKKECRSLLHGAWGKKIKAAGEEQAV